MTTKVNPRNGKPNESSAGKLFGWHTIYEKGADGNPYMTRIWVGRLRLHIFHRGDLDPDCHDHPWDFWTFPLTPYVEEVVRIPTGLWWSPGEDPDMPEGWDIEYRRYRHVVPAWRWTFRPATHTHRVLGAWDGPGIGHRNAYPAVHPSRKIVTIVWRGKSRRAWGFLKNRDGKWCWIAWRDYIFNGGKEAPCE